MLCCNTFFLLIYCEIYTVETKLVEGVLILKTINFGGFYTNKGIMNVSSCSGGFKIQKVHHESLRKLFTSV